MWMFIRKGSHYWGIGHDTEENRHVADQDYYAWVWLGRHGACCIWVQAEVVMLIPASLYPVDMKIVDEWGGRTKTKL